MEDYEKLYKNAVKRIQTTYQDDFGCVHVKPEEIFPELKESEGERIKEDLIQWINEFPDVIWRGHNTKDVIAWLEKQDPKKHEEELEKAYKTADEVQYRRGYEAAKREFEKQGEMKPQGNSALEIWKDMRLEVYQQASGNRHEPNYSDDSTKMFSLTDIDEIFEKVAENKGKQKHADKIEPKFKVGDYIINEYGFIMQVDGINNNKYTYHVLDDNKHQTCDIKQAEKSCHLWTIQDAKDGDILCCENGWTCIFKNLDSNSFSSYCFMDCSKWFCELGGECHSLNKNLCGKIHPVTKEQRDLLFEKMKEAGYEWDDEKKELKKIDKKATWSEEDEEMFDSIIADIQFTQKAHNHDVNQVVYEREIDWLKSLKERMRGE